MLTPSSPGHLTIEISETFWHAGNNEDVVVETVSSAFRRPVFVNCEGFISKLDITNAKLFDVADSAASSVQLGPFSQSNHHL
jgi:hypothetical protein